MNSEFYFDLYKDFNPFQLIRAHKQFSLYGHHKRNINVLNTTHLRNKNPHAGIHTRNELSAVLIQESGGAGLSAKRMISWKREERERERDTNDTNDVLLRETKRTVMSISDTSTGTK